MNQVNKWKKNGEIICASFVAAVQLGTWLMPWQYEEWYVEERRALGFWNRQVTLVPVGGILSLDSTLWEPQSSCRPPSNTALVNLEPIPRALPAGDIPGWI